MIILNIQSLFRSMMGEPNIQDSKVLELKTGQVVRGVVQQDLGNQEALISISGIQVRAKLEAPLQQGEATMLQVQGETSSGQVLLKPVVLSGHPSDAGLSDLLKAFGLKDTLANREMLIAMQGAGIPLTKENALRFAELLAAKPAEMDAKPWLQAMAIAHVRGLPTSTAVLQALSEVLTGGSLSERLNAVEQQVQQTLQSQGGSLPEAVRAGLQKVLQLLQQLDGLGPQSAGKGGAAAQAMPGSAGQASALPGGGGQAGAEPGAAAAAGRAPLPTAPAGDAGASAPLAQAAARSEAQPAPPGASSGGFAAELAGTLRGGAAGGLAGVAVGSAAGGSAGSAAGPAQAPAAAAPAALTAPAAGAAAPELARAAGTAPQAGAAVPPQAAAEAPPAGAPSAAQTAAQAAGAASPAAGPASSTPAAPAGAASPAADPQGGWIGSVLKLLGVEHEQLLARGASAAAGGAAASSLLSDEAAAGLLRVTAETLPHANAIQQQQSLPGDSLKSLLLLLAKSDDLPASLRETMTQTAQQITGQQLLLSSDRHAPFTHLTLFIPFKNEGGRQTASVYIQSRKDGKGTLDKDNCRLVFDLNMQALGDTLVEVQVVNAIVSLKVHNDHPAAPELFESFREEIAQGLQQIGFQFLSMKCSPFPDKSEASVSGLGKRPTDADLSFYQPKPYKGVDYRI